MRRTFSFRGLALTFDAAGVVTIYGGQWFAHFGVRSEHRQWGYHQWWYDGPIDTFGLGPLFLVGRGGA